MANADKCHLNIPFKQYLMSLSKATDDEGNLDPKALELAGQREFENYKAIERRVNASGCGGGACTCHWAQYVADANSVVLTAATSAAVDLAWNAAPVVQSGGFSSSGGTPTVPDTTVLYNASVVMSFIHSSGASPVMANLQISDRMTTLIVSGYLPASFSVDLTQTRPVQIGSTSGGQLIVSAGLTSPGAATRTVGIYAEMFLASTCCAVGYA